MNPDDLFLLIFLLACVAGVVAIVTAHLCAFIWRRRLDAAAAEAGQRGFDQGTLNGLRMERRQQSIEDINQADWWKGTGQ